MNFSNYFQIKFWINPFPLSLSGLNFKLFIGFFTLCFVAYILIKFVFRKKKGDYYKFFKKLGNLLLTLAIIGYILTFFASESIPYLSMRLWYLLAGAGVLVWLAFILKYLLLALPKEKKERLDQEQFNKYLPKSK